jgi:hypothetical protein
MGRMRKRSRVFPDKWPPTRMAEYELQYKERTLSDWQDLLNPSGAIERRMHADMRNVGKVGYELGQRTLGDNRLDIGIAEEIDISDDDAHHFKDHMAEALESTGKVHLKGHLNVSPGDRGVSIDFDPASLSEQDGKFLRLFLKVYSSVLEKETAE